jgi:hypothetical protein
MREQIMNDDRKHLNVLYLELCKLKDTEECSRDKSAGSFAEACERRLTLSDVIRVIWGLMWT